MPHRNYPTSVSEVLDPAKKYKPATLRAVRKFARAKPWRGSYAERAVKFGVLVQELATTYGIRCPHLICDGVDGEDSGQSCYVPVTNTIILRGRLSVVTLLHEFGHVLGKDEREACRWSINLFRRCFPRSWERVRFDGHIVRNGM